ncbi:hypothetical protein Tco_0145214 [Tanacetum coccineum]
MDHPPMEHRTTRLESGWENLDRDLGLSVVDEIDKAAKLSIEADTTIGAESIIWDLIQRGFFRLSVLGVTFGISKGFDLHYTLRNVLFGEFEECSKVVVGRFVQLLVKILSKGSPWKCQVLVASPYPSELVLINSVALRRCGREVACIDECISIFEVLVPDIFLVCSLLVRMFSACFSTAARRYRENGDALRISSWSSNGGVFFEQLPDIVVHLAICWDVLTGE